MACFQSCLSSFGSLCLELLKNMAAEDNKKLQFPMFSGTEADYQCLLIDKGKPCSNQNMTFLELIDHYQKSHGLVFVKGLEYCTDCNVFFPTHYDGHKISIFFFVCHLIENYFRDRTLSEPHSTI